jgi:transposase, IS5 family
MPRDNISKSHLQCRLTEQRLSVVLNNDHKICKLTKLINWTDLEKELTSVSKVCKKGRNKKDLRLMSGLVMLQAMGNYSDLGTRDNFIENYYWQHFCGFEYLVSDSVISESSIRRFRQEIGEAGMNMIMKYLVQAGVGSGLLKKKDLEEVIIDTTVQIKNIKYPHDAYLLERSREALSYISKEIGIKLNDTYEKFFKYRMIKLWKYKKESKAKPRLKLIKLMKTRLGRLIRIVERYIEKENVVLNEKLSSDLNQSKKIYAQTIFDKKEKAKYKESNKMIYSFHASEVECIGKGKLNKPYEFGNKVGIVVSGHKNFVIGVKSSHDNPYDGHTLKESMEVAKNITGVEASKAFVDLGYRGHNVSEKKKIFMPSTKRSGLSDEEKMMMKRRSAIEPIIGHLKQYGRMGRNFLQGVFGDMVNPIISAIGVNMRNLLNFLERGKAKIDVLTKTSFRKKKTIEAT